jgi:hypothetical protein
VTKGFKEEKGEQHPVVFHKTATALLDSFFTMSLTFAKVKKG